MTMRKYLVTVHSDGTLSALEFEEHEDVIEDERRASFRRGYMTAIYESRKKILEFRERREDSREANLMYAAVASVHDFVKSRMSAYEP